MNFRRYLNSLVFIAAVVTVECTDSGTLPLFGGLDIEPESISFDGVAVGDSADAMLILRNVGEDIITVESIAISDTAYSIVGPTSFEIGGFSSVEVVVRFQALSDTATPGEIIFKSDALNADVLGILTVSISASTVRTFTMNVMPIMVPTCATAGCHDAATMEQGMDASVYSSVLTKVVPGDPGASLLWAKLKPRGNMPIGIGPGSVVSDADQDIIRQWILGGALE